MHAYAHKYYIYIYTHTHTYTHIYITAQPSLRPIFKKKAVENRCLLISVCNESTCPQIGYKKHARCALYNSESSDMVRLRYCVLICVISIILSYTSQTNIGLGDPSSCAKLVAVFSARRISSRFRTLTTGEYGSTSHAHIHMLGPRRVLYASPLISNGSWSSTIPSVPKKCRRGPSPTAWISEWCSILRVWEAFVIRYGRRQEWPRRERFSIWGNRF
jgi:hypothetical protein